MATSGSKGSILPPWIAWKQMKGVLLCSLALLASPALPCGCQVTVPVCNEVAYSNAVFFGTVESISPTFLSDWSLSRRPSLQQLNQANERFLFDHSPQNLTTLKDVLDRKSVV